MIYEDVPEDMVVMSEAQYQQWVQDAAIEMEEAVRTERYGWLMVAGSVGTRVLDLTVSNGTRNVLGGALFVLGIGYALYGEKRQERIDREHSSILTPVTWHDTA